MTRPIQFNEEPQNLEDIDATFVELESLNVMQWHSQRDGKGKPEAVILELRAKGFEDFRFIVRFIGPRTLDALIAALAVHRRAVFGND